MFFKVIGHFDKIPSAATDMAFLRENNWNDYNYRTLFELVYVDELGRQSKIGEVKIGRVGMLAQTPATGANMISPSLKPSFNGLSSSCFSLGQDDTYYVNLCQLGSNVRQRILVGLHDIAYETDAFLIAIQEDVTKVSLLRFVTKEDVLGHFRRLAHGNTQRLIRYSFYYDGPWKGNPKPSSLLLDFAVDPYSLPRSNLHVLIGRNGVGKTRLLHAMAQALIAKSEDERTKYGQFKFDKSEGNEKFSNVVFIAFSAFDPFAPIPERRDKSQGVQSAYVGIKKVRPVGQREKKVHPPKSPNDLAEEFAESLFRCRQGKRAERWQKAIATLIQRERALEDHLVDLRGLVASNDFVQQALIGEEVLELDNDVLRVKMLNESNLTDEDKEGTSLFKRRARTIFRPLSSGHKIVLLSLTKLVERVQNQTLVLIDEPESHLHPSLLSAFISAISDFLHERNSAAIIATHSPVLLQEVPRECVWRLRSSAMEPADRLKRETFGENVAVLTADVFGLQVEDAGFYQILESELASDITLPQALKRFGNRLGGDAEAILRTLFARKQQ